MTAWNDDEQLPTFERAELSRRISAGAIDFFAVLLLVALYFAFPLITGGTALPIWGVFAAVVGYAVVPLALYGATPAMALFELEMVSTRGRAVPVTDLLFRELIGRGYFPLAYLGSLLVAFIGTLLGMTRFTMPVGAGFVLFLLSMGLLFAAAAGNLLAIVRSDGRSLADLVSRTVVIPRRPKQAPTDAEERDEARRADGRRLRTLIIAEVCMVVIGLGLPYLISRRVPGEDTATYAERLVRERLEQQFAQDPSNERLANDLARSWDSVGNDDEVRKVREQYRAALVAKQQRREQGLRELLLANPHNDAALSELMALLERQGRKDEAKAAYATWIEAEPRPERRAGFGIWLYQTGYSKDAVDQLSSAFDAGFEDAESRAYRGFAHKDLGQFKEARADFEAALKLDPSLAEVAIALEETMAQ